MKEYLCQLKDRGIFFKQNIQEIIQGIEEEKALDGEKFTIREMERAKKALEAKLEKLNNAEKKNDDVITFEQLRSG